ncbi:MAG: group 1 truncated hemoglobin [Planctomycetes bacterium]|nr:group 1 truncated hemoglobin [Planctomycetota bacterium]MBI3848188.1 group 1 truncated hemoglobin [Planctomycetota bacterium]
MSRIKRCVDGFVAVMLAFVAGCGSQETKDRTFFTSGSREADQRAEQRMAKAGQLGGANRAGDGSKATDKKTLNERLGGDSGIDAIVDDFVNRAIADPRVNWERKGVSSGGFLGIGSHSMQRELTDGEVARLKRMFAQFISLATGGPAEYEGRDMKEVHHGMHITNAEFDATIGDLKVTLDKLQIANPEQKELLAIMESTRPQVVEDR